MHTRRAALGLIALAPAATALKPTPAHAREPEVFQNPIAISAHDPAAYFTDEAPVPGLAEHAVQWNGAEWHFASAANADLFRSNREAFAPVFGGYCAYAASRGHLAPTIPEAWAVFEGRLYLNASLRARTLWARDVRANIAAGQRNWPGILG